MVRTADMITLPGLKKAPKKRIAAILEPVDELGEETDDINEENEEENTEDTEELGKLSPNVCLLPVFHAKYLQISI